MLDTTTWTGARKGLIIGLSTSPFGLLFGAVAVDGGVTPLQATLMSGVIFAGASQLVGVQMFGTSVPAWLIILSVFAVNFRHILYSAALAPHIRHFRLLPDISACFSSLIRNLQNRHVGSISRASWSHGFIWRWR